jgi:hypothetical protein
MKYYFSGDKSTTATASEIAAIGIDNARIWGGRLIIPLEADTRAEAWEKAKAKVAEYEAANPGVKIINLGWSDTDHYGID